MVLVLIGWVGPRKWVLVLIGWVGPKVNGLDLGSGFGLNRLSLNYNTKAKGQS